MTAGVIVGCAIVLDFVECVYGCCVATKSSDVSMCVIV